MDEGRDNFIKAIKAAEMVAKQLENLPQDFGKAEPEDATILFRDYSEEWLKNNRKQWDELTYEKYEGIFRLHIWPFDEFSGDWDGISRVTVKRRLRDLLKTRPPSLVKSAHTVLTSIFNEAIDHKHVVSNPASILMKKILPPIGQGNPLEPCYIFMLVIDPINR